MLLASTTTYGTGNINLETVTIFISTINLPKLSAFWIAYSMHNKTHLMWINSFKQNETTNIKRIHSYTHFLEKLFNNSLMTIRNKMTGCIYFILTFRTIRNNVSNINVTLTRILHNSFCSIKNLNNSNVRVPQESQFPQTQLSRFISCADEEKNTHNC